MSPKYLLHAINLCPIDGTDREEPVALELIQSLHISVQAAVILLGNRRTQSKMDDAELEALALAQPFRTSSPKVRTCVRQVCEGVDTSLERSQHS